jgi:hypothetical protein
MEAQIDSLSIADLEDRYEVNRPSLYARIDKLKKKGYVLQLEKHEGKVRANADQIMLLDAYDAHLKSGEKTSTFPNFGEDVSRSLARQPEMSGETQDNNLVRLPGRSASSSLVSTQQIIDIAQILAAIVPAPQAAPPPDPLENLRRIEEAHRNSWKLSSSQLAPLLGLKSLTGKEFSRFGYTFTRCGKNGGESAWSISRDK